MQALRAVDVTPPEQPELVHPHNLFRNSPAIDLEGHIEIREPLAKKGDYVVLHAMDKLVVVVTACSVVGVVNGVVPGSGSSFIAFRVDRDRVVATIKVTDR